MRTRAVTSRSPDTQPSARLRELSDGYRVASEILVAVADMGASDAIYEFVWSICEREGKAWEEMHGRATA